MTPTRYPVTRLRGTPGPPGEAGPQAPHRGHHGRVRWIDLDRLLRPPPVHVTRREPRQRPSPGAGPGGPTTSVRCTTLADPEEEGVEDDGDVDPGEDADLLDQG